MAKLVCSFCGKKAADVAKLVAGPRVLFRRRVYICDGCIASARRIIEEAGIARLKPDANASSTTN